MGWAWRSFSRQVGLALARGFVRSFIHSFNRSDRRISYAIVVFDWVFPSTPVPVVLSQIHTQARIGCIHPVYFYEQVNVLSVHLAAATETERQEQCDRTTRTTTSTGTTIDGANLCPASCKFWSEHLGCVFSIIHASAGFCCLFPCLPVRECV